ncbi:MAG: LolA-related protein [Candidatus Limnocylindrales bacterium]|jgi:hypothetical protein
MTSGLFLRLFLRLAVACLASATTTLHSAEPGLDALLARLARPAPDTTSFVEVRYSSLLETPIVVSGRLEHRQDGSLVRRVDSPYREVTELRGKSVSVEREGSKPRHFSLNRAPELRGMLASFSAILQGDREMLDRYFVVALQGTDARWEITLVPRDAKLKRRLARITVNGADDRPRCFILEEPDEDASLMVIGVERPDDLPQPLDQKALTAWCAADTMP